MDQALTDLRTARLSALQNQITPHYIVNTLDAIRMKLLIDGQSDSAELLRCFQDSLRTYAFSPLDTVALEQELSFLESYLQLQKFRFMGTLIWNVVAEPTVLSLPIPRFLLQPLVENAVRHGLTPDMDTPRLQICAELDGDALVLSVTDNGKGISPAAVYGTGLTNVKERIQLLYGDRSAVTIEVLPGSGTCVALRLPEKGGGLL